MGIYQYGCALALCLYSSDATWTQSMLGQVCLCVLYPSSVSDVMCSDALMTLVSADFPPGCCPPRLVLLRHLLLCEASFPPAVLTPQEALPGGPTGHGLPAGHQPCRPPPHYLQLDN